eukprot:TRINITY_DN28306_c0_g1_i1.p1 TRINITY_DN28306_c0_g1~~TRINITY_DN28306_c0_g1_i1.p1  ORF type:complete len:266 (+),score=49.23 TRINITY_DN28306_c0_g1_i1:64-861(+)
MAQPPQQPQAPPGYAYPVAQQGYPAGYGSGYPPPQGYQPPTQGFGGQQPVPQQGYPAQQPGYPPASGPGYPATGANQWWYQPPPSKDSVHETLKVQKNEWDVPLLLACTKEPLWCICGFFCAPCTAFAQRRKLVLADKDEANWRNYQCCAGMCCADKTDKCTKGNECFCAALESCCCLGCAAHANRYMVMVHYGLEYTCCDLFLFYLSFCCSIVAMITGDDTLQSLADLLFYILMGCMHAQHENEMKKHGYPSGGGVVVAQVAHQ